VFVECRETVCYRLQECKISSSGSTVAPFGKYREDAILIVEVKNLSLQSRIDKLLKVKNHSSWRMRYHAFVSHAQLEASGK
jgi:hypothetical protein